MSNSIPAMATDETSRRRARTALLLVEDRRCGQEIERRRGDCARLAACEMAWIEVHGGAQAKCLPRCDGYARISLRRMVGGSVGGLVSMVGS